MVRGPYETRRLVLTLAAPELAEPLAAYYRRNRAFLAPFDAVHEEAFYTDRDQRRRLEGEARDAGEDRGYRFYLSLRETPGEIVGLAGLNNLVRGAFQSCFLSYKLDERYLNQGYATEAVLEVKRIAFQELGLHRIEANIMPRNKPSLRVAEKAGFYHEGLARAYLKINGVWEDHIHMVCINEA